MFFVLIIYNITQSFPLEERFGITNQLRRASVSITSNIAEGFTRGGKKEKIQFYRTALASLTEVQNQLLICRDISYITKDKFNEIAQQSVTAQKILSGLIKTAPAIQDTKYTIHNTQPSS